MKGERPARVRVFLAWFNFIIFSPENVEPFKIVRFAGKFLHFLKNIPLAAYRINVIPSRLYFTPEA